MAGTRELSAAVQAAIAAGTLRPAIFAEIEFGDGTGYMWNGVGSITWTDNETPPVERTFTGFGNAAGISVAQEASDLKATGVRVSLAGIPSDVLSEVLGQIRHGKNAVIWLGFIDIATNAVVDYPVIVFSGFLDTAQVDDAGDSAGCQLSLENSMIALDEAKKRRYTTEDQKLVDLTDKGFDFVPALQEKQITWGIL